MEKPAKKMTVKELQKVLNERGVPCANDKKAALEFLVEKALELGLEVDPDGLFEDRHAIFASCGRLACAPETVVVWHAGIVVTVNMQLLISYTCVRLI